MAPLFRSNLSDGGGAANLQPNKIVFPDPYTDTEVTADAGYDGLAKVMVGPMSHTSYNPGQSSYIPVGMGETSTIDLGELHDCRYVRVRGDAPSGNKSITSNGTGIDVSAYATVSVAVPSEATVHTETFTPTPNLAGAAGNANDMGVNHTKRFINTTGMVIPSGSKFITANGDNIDVTNYSTVKVSVPSSSAVTIDTLWTNPNPTTDSFASQIVALSSSMSGYSLIGFLYTSDPTVNARLHQLVNWVTPNNLAKSKTPRSMEIDIPFVSLSEADGDGSFTIRGIYYYTDSGVEFGTAYYVDDQGYTATNSGPIPLKIFGLSGPVIPDLPS